MSLLNVLMSAGGGAAAGKLGERFGLDERQVNAALQQLVPALSGGIRRNVAAEGGADGLLGALAAGKHRRYLEDPSLLAEQEATREGNGILGHLLGSKDASREVAARASAASGISAEVLKQMLPLTATMVMGALSRKSSEAGLLDGGNAPPQPAGLMGMLRPLLDADGDGSIADDALGMIGRFFGNR